MKLVLNIYCVFLATVCTYSQEFELSILSQNISVLSGEKVIVPLKITPTNGFLSSVYLSLGTGSASTPISFSTSTVNAPYDTVHITISPSEYDSGYKTFTIIGKNGPVQRSTDFSVYVKYNPIRKWFRFGKNFSFDGSSIPTLDINGDVCFYTYGSPLGNNNINLYHVRGNSVKIDTLYTDFKLYTNTKSTSTLLFDKIGNIYFSFGNYSLYKYDGTFFTSLSNLNLDGFIFNNLQMVLDDESNIYCFAQTGYNKTRIAKLHHVSNSWEILFDVDSTLIFEDRPDRNRRVVTKSKVFYFPHLIGGVIQHDGKKQTMITDGTNLLVASIFAIKQTDDDKLWLLNCANKDTALIVIDGNVWKRYTIPGTIWGKCLETFYIAKNGHIYVSGGKGLLHFDGIKWNEYSSDNSLMISGNYPLAYQEDKYGNIWMYMGYSTIGHKHVMVFNPDGIKVIDDNMTSVESQEVPKSILVKPNPSQEIVTITTTDTGNVPITILNSLGQVVYSEQCTVPTVVLSTTQFASGIYYCKVGDKVTPFVVQH
ncbi:MAG: T9SS type A sorting domain-containing protein [Candidatus Kapaibacterium sp.]